MTSNVTHLTEVAAGEGFRITASAVLEGALKADLADVVVVGRNPDGSVYLASNIGDGLTTLRLAQAQHLFVAGSMGDTQ